MSEHMTKPPAQHRQSPPVVSGESLWVRVLRIIALAVFACLGLALLLSLDSPEKELRCRSEHHGGLIGFGSCTTR